MSALYGRPGAQGKADITPLANGPIPPICGTAKGATAVPLVSSHAFRSYPICFAVFIIEAASSGLGNPNTASAPADLAAVKNVFISVLLLPEKVVSEQVHIEYPSCWAYAFPAA